MVEWVQALRDRGLKTAILSNMSRNVGDYLRREAKWLELFNQICFSGELKMGKPDHAIYRSCLESLGVTAADALFIDDREVNVKAADALGMHGIWFHTPRELAPQLAPYGLADSLAEVLARAG
jgi:HAD superfamily hydrolase (TIGR01509 family)